MYAAVDIGGTKTLVASLSDDGVITEKIRFETPQNYADFVTLLRQTASRLQEQSFTAAGVAAPGVIDREHGRVVEFGNLAWTNVALRHDAEAIFNCPVILENDAKLATLSEAMLVKNLFKKVMYVTISTGIGIGLVVNGRIDTAIGDAGGRTILMEHGGKRVPWESFASGHAIAERYGKPAHDITDAATWQAVSKDLAPGLIELIALMEPEVIIFGGSVGTYFDRFAVPLQSELESYRMPLLHLPVLRQAARPEEAVLFGCYDLAVSTYTTAVGDRT